MQISETSAAPAARLRLVAMLAAAALLILGISATRAAAAPAFVQVASNEITTGKVNGVAFPTAVGAGNTIVVYAMWSHTGTATVADSRGNTYVPVGAAQAWGGSGSAYRAQVFLASNVAPGATTVTATFGTTINSFGIVYAHEYSGIDPVNPVDVNKSAAGNGSNISSGAFTTTNANDLLFTGIASAGTVSSVAAAYTTRSTAFGNRTADRTVTQTGSYTVTGVHNGGRWAVHHIALRSAGGGDGTAPSVPAGLSATAASSSQIDLSWNPSIDNVGVTNYVITRNGTQIVTPTNATQYSDTGLSPSTAYTYTVAARDAAGNTSAASSPPVTTSTQAAPSDTQNPVATMTAPASGATVSGASVQVTANATDNTGVVGVQFLLDGNPLGAEDTSSPYAISWDTTAASNGPHTLAARARDAAGNTATSPGVTVTVSNSTGSGPGPAAAYAFEENQGASTADVSGHGITGALTNGPLWVAGRYGRALQFDGNDDFVNLGNPTGLQLTGSMTISAWVKTTAFPGDDATIVSKRTNQGFQLDTTRDTGPRTIGFKLTASGGGDMFRYGQTPLQTGTWYHVAGVYDATARTMHVYLNGVLDDGNAVGTVAASQINSTGNVNIGRRSAGGYATNGVIDDVRIYNRALTASEINSDLQTGLGGGAPADQTAPQVSLTAPAAGATVSQIVNITANASDNVGVAGVTFLVDGQVAGAEDTDAPYGLQWDTRGVQNGTHTLTARARDAAGNTTTSAARTVTVANSGRFQNDVLATGFDLPTAMRFLPDGRLLVVELAGKVKVVPPPYTSVSPTPFLQLTNVGSAGVQQGIYELQLDPNFTTNHFYYVFYTAGSPNRDRLSRFTANADFTGTVAGSEKILYQDTLDANAEHHGGAIMFGNDGKLYFTTGEHFQGDPAQQLSSPRGKIHRINPDGTVPTDGPFYDGSGPNWDSVWARDLRNPFRAYYDAPTGRMFVGDVGGNDYATAYEEIDLGAAGANYAWPNCEHSCASPPYTNGIYDYAHNGRDSAVVAGFVYHGTQFPSDYQGSFFFADYTQNWIKRLKFNAAGDQVTQVLPFEPADGSNDGPYGDIVYLVEGPDGALYYMDLGYSDIGGTFGVSKLRRISFISGNQPPTAIASANPTSGPTPLSVDFSSAGSTDPEGGALTYSWDFGDGQSSTAANPTHAYATAGSYSVRLSVSDGTSTTLSAPIAISAGAVPVVTLTAPTDNATFRAGDTINYSATATDPDDGTLPASAFTWNIDFLHEGHVHPGTPVTGVKSGSFQIPTSGHDFSGFTRYRVCVTAKDSTNLSTTKCATVFPQKVNLTVDTVPSGLTVNLDGIAKVTPFSYDDLIGFQHSIAAPNQVFAGRQYNFASWSDGGAASHTITVPATNASYTATYTSTTVAPPAFVQQANAVPQSPQTTVNVPFPNAQGAGNLNAVVIGFDNATSTISSVTDSAGNTYAVAAPLTRSSANSQAIYYAKSIKPGANTVTVTFNGSTPFPDVRIAEYSGLDTVSPLDVTASAPGVTSSLSSGNATTTKPVELLVGAGTTTGNISAAGSGWTQRVITFPNGDILQDRVTSATGQFASTATGSTANWVMQLAAFKAAGQ